MTKRKQTVIKKFRGPKQAQKEANAKFMAGELEPQYTSKRAALNITKEEVVLDIENDDDVQDDNDDHVGYQMRHSDSGHEPNDDDDDDHGSVRTSEKHDDGEVDEMIIGEDEQMQMITPPKKAKRPKQNHDERPITIEHYISMVNTLQVKLRNAEQQIRAISKGSLADKFMSAQVKKYVKESLWKRCKFITCRETMEECMEEVAKQFGIIGEKREHWKSTYEHAVRDALNNRRNNTAQGLKKELTGTCVVPAG
jgi:hypothetical protein